MLHRRRYKCYKLESCGRMTTLHKMYFSNAKFDKISVRLLPKPSSTTVEAAYHIQLVHQHLTGKLLRSVSKDGMTCLNVVW